MVSNLQIQRLSNSPLTCARRPNAGAKSSAQVESAWSEPNMKTISLTKPLVAVTLPLLLAAAVNTFAQSYPNRPIRWIVTYPPGGPTDVVARAIGAKLTEAWGQQIVIDNRAGAGGVIGTDLAAKAVPDGYTLLFGTSAGLTINPALSSKLPYDAVKDFAPVSLLV